MNSAICNLTIQHYECASRHYNERLTISTTDRERRTNIKYNYRRQNSVKSHCGIDVGKNSHRLLNSGMAGAPGVFTNTAAPPLTWIIRNHNHQYWHRPYARSRKPP